MSTEVSLPVIASLWIDSRLSKIEIASINSFLRHGHDFILYGYQEIENIPKGVTLKDAAEIYDCGRILVDRKHKSPAIHSDVFRYKLMKKTDYIWSDLDIIALRPFNFSNRWVVSYENNSTVGVSVLRIPRESAIFIALDNIDDKTDRLPPMLSGFRKFKYCIKALYLGNMRIENWSYGMTGPRLITYLFDKYSCEKTHILEKETFYPIALEKVDSLLSVPASISLNEIPKQVYAIHLWGKQLKTTIDKNYSGKIPESCLLDQILSL